MSIEHYNSTSLTEIKLKQAIIVDFIESSGLWFLIPIINRVGFFQGKWIPCCQSQQLIADSLGCNRKTINETVGIAAKLGIIKIKKKRYPGSKWLHNEMSLTRIMFTKEIRKALGHILTIFHLVKDVSIASVTLIEQELSKVLNPVQKSEQDFTSQVYFSKKAKMWDEIVGSSPTTAHQYSVNV